MICKTLPNGFLGFWDIIMQLDDQQIERYQQHIILKDIGGEGQKRLLASRVLIVGVGGLGSPAALYLAAAGVGTIGLCDDDRVELSNLQRQILYSTRNIGDAKVEGAKKRLSELNPDVTIKVYGTRMSEKNVQAIIQDYDFIIDASDNFPTKHLINDTCAAMGKPYSHGGVVGFKGQTFTYAPPSMCYRCIFPLPPPDDLILYCRGSGILGSVAGIIGSIQATETIKYLLGKSSLLTNKLLTVDTLTSEFRTIDLKPNMNCPICNKKVASIKDNAS
jgi:adenylyltransferase/sulfurtransferase